MRCWVVVWGMLACAGCGDDGGTTPREDAGAADAGAAADAHLHDGEVPEDAFVPPFDGPMLLSETGLYSDIGARTLAPGVMPFEVGYELWSDGAEKRRWLLLPAGTQIDTRDIDRWRFPIGTKAFKEFRRDGVLVETRMLEKRSDDPTEGWLRVAYIWNAAGTDAVAAPDGMPDANGTMHDVPSSHDCFTCHRGVVDTLIGVSAIQLATADGGAFLTMLADRGLLTDPPAAMPAVPGPPATQAALGFLHANCGHCHNEDHPLATRRTMRLWLPVGTAMPEDAPVYRTAIGAMASHLIDGTDIIIVPGEPENSHLYVRMMHRDLEQMPPLGTELPTTEGLATIAAWIRSLPPP